MTIPAGQSGVTYHTGNGTASTFDYEFKITAEADLKVTQTDTNKIDTLLVLGTDYTVSGVGNNAGGAITLVAGPLASGYTLTIEDNVEISQLTPFGNQSAFYANLHEDSYDKNTRIARKAIYELDRTIKISGSVQGVDTELPKPESLKLFRWNETATALENVETSDLITVAQFSNFRTDTFNDGVDFTSGSTTEINLSSSPGVKANTQIYFDGVYQEKSEYSLNGNLITFNSAIPSGISVIEVTHGKAADVLALDLVSEILSSPYTTTVSDNGKYFEVIGNQTITLVDALSAGAGYRIAVKSDSSSTVTVARSGSDTIDDATSVQIGPDSFAFFIVNSLRNGYISDISKTFQIINVDNINENTPSSGVTIDGVLLKDGGGNLTGNLDVGQTLTVDTVNETTLDTGVTVDGVLLKDGGAVFADGATIEVDTINEATAAAGVTADGVLLKDGGITATAASSITAASGTALRITNTGSGDSFLVEDSTNPDSSPFVIDNDGRIVQGHTASLAGASPASFEQHSTSDNSTVGAPNASLASWSSDGGFAGGLTFDRSLSGTVGTETTVVNGTDLGSIYWRGTDGSGFLQAAEILGEMDATPAGSGVDMPGRLSFRTTAVGSASPIERMRINRDGNILVNTATAATGSPKLDLVGDDRQCIVMSDNTTDATQKNASIGGRHHTNAEEPVSVIKSISDGANNSVLVGGGESFFNAATLVRLYAAANTTTLTGTEQVRISSDSANFIGDVLIGDSVAATPSAKLHVTNTGSGDSLLVEDSASPDSTPFVITSNGTVGLGTTAPSLFSGVGPIVVSEASAAYGPQSSWRNTASDATAGYFHFEKSRSGGLVSESDVVGTLSWRAHDGVNFRGVAAISALAGATPAAGDTPGILYFATTEEGATSSTERMRIDSSGRVIVGSTASQSVGDNTGTDTETSLQLHGTTQPTSSMTLGNWSATGTSEGSLIFARSKSGTVGTDTVLADGDNLGSVAFSSPNVAGTAWGATAQIFCEVDGTPSTYAPGRLSFFTSDGSAATSTERMRIQSDGDINLLGDVKIGGAGGDNPDGKLHVHSATAGTVTASTDADELVVENNGSCGISLLAPDAQNTNLYFGSPTDNVGAYLRWNHDADLLKISTDKAGAKMAFQTGSSTERMRIDAGIQVGAPTGGDKGAGTINVESGIYVNGVKLNGDVINVRDYGAVGDDSTDDSTAFQNAINAAVAAQTRLHIPEGAYYFASRLTFTGTVDVTSDKTASMRWDGIAANVGILLDFEGAGDTLTDMEFPMLFGPVYTAGAAGGLPGYSTGTQNPANRIGTAIECRGGNRINVYAHIMNGFENGYYVKSTASSSCDNYNLEVNTSDFCEKWLHLDSDAGRGIATLTARANTVWAKFPIYFSTTSNYVNGANIEITGVAYVNEDGGCGIYSEGTNLRSSTIRINQLQAGTRSDSRTDTSVLLSPSGTMSSTPVQGETITQATSGATGIVVTNADYTLGTTIPFTVKTVSGTFNTANQLTGSTSGSLGAGSVPASVRGMVCPWIGGNQTMNGLVYDAEQSGTVGYFGGTHCDIQIGAPADFPGGVTDGAMSIFPQPGESVRIRDMGKHNNIKVLFADVEGDSSSATAYTLSSTPGEANFAGGVGSAPFSDYVYCYISANSLASGAVLQRYLYHSKVTDSTTMQPCQVIFKNEGSNDRNLDISAVAFSNGLTNNREIIVKIKNISSTSLETTQNVYFWVKVGP